MRKWIVIGVALVVVIALVVGLDRWGLARAQNAMSGALKTKFGLTHEPGVTIKGSPYLQQGIAGHYDHVTVRIGDWSSVQQSMDVRGAVADLRKVSDSLTDVQFGKAADLSVGSATVTGLVPYSDLQKHALSWQITGVQPIGQDLRLTGSIQGAVALINFTTTEHPQLVPGRGIVLNPTSLQVLNGQGKGGYDRELPEAEIRKRIVIPLPLLTLPGGYPITGLQVRPTGFWVTAKG